MDVGTQRGVCSCGCCRPAVSQRQKKAWLLSGELRNEAKGLAVDQQEVRRAQARSPAVAESGLCQARRCDSTPVPLRRPWSQLRTYSVNEVSRCALGPA